MPPILHISYSRASSVILDSACFAVQRRPPRLRKAIDPEQWRIPTGRPTTQIRRPQCTGLQAASQHNRPSCRLRGDLVSERSRVQSDGPTPGPSATSQLYPSVPAVNLVSVDPAYELTSQRRLYRYCNTGLWIRRICAPLTGNDSGLSCIGSS
jgi:hypothetical protein